MSSIEDRANELLKEDIDLLIQLQDEEMLIKEKKAKIVEGMARKLEASGMDPSKISSTIKRILKQNYIEISDKTIERACGIGKKRAYDRYQDDAIRQMSDSQQAVTVASDGSESYTRPDGSEGERETPSPSPDRQQLEHLYERMQDNELERKLREEIADKDKALEQERLRNGELDVRCNALDKQISELKQQQKAGILRSKEYQDLLIASQQQEQRINQLEEIETKRVKEKDFAPASTMATQSKEIWIDPADAIRIFVSLRRCMDSKVRAFLQVDEVNGKVITVYNEAQRIA